MSLSPLHLHGSPGYLGSFESGGSSGSRSPHGLLGLGLGSLGGALSPVAAGAESKAAPPAAVAVTVLQPVLPDESHGQGQPLLGLLTDQVDQMVSITSWPAERLPFRVHHGTVLTLRLFRQAAEKKNLQFGSPLKANCESDIFVAGIQVPVGILMSRGAPVQCWCALQNDQGATASSYPMGPAAAVEAFESLRHKATYDVDLPKVFIALRPLRLDQVPTNTLSTFSPRSLASPSHGLAGRGMGLSTRAMLSASSPMTPVGDEVARLMAMAREDQQLDASPPSGAFGTPLSPQALGGTSREREVTMLRRELQAERSQRQAEADGMNQSMSELYQMLEVESAANAKWKEDSLAAQHSWCRDRFQWREELEASLVRANSAQSPDGAALAINGRTEAALEDLTSELQSSQGLLAKRDDDLRAAKAIAAQADARIAELLKDSRNTVVCHAKELEAIQAQESRALARHAEQLRKVETVSENAIADKHRDEGLARSVQLQRLVDEVAELMDALQHQESRADIEARHADAEQQAAAAYLDKTSELVVRLRTSEDALSSAEARLADSAIPQAQSLLQALLKQEESNAYLHTEVLEMEAAGGPGRGSIDIDGVRAQLLSSIEGRVEMLQDELSQEREHFSYHTGHGASLEVQFEELAGYTEARDRQLEASCAEVKALRLELEEQGPTRPKALLDAALAREEGLRIELVSLEQVTSQETASREKMYQNQLQDARSELKATLGARSNVPMISNSGASTPVSNEETPPQETPSYQLLLPRTGQPAGLAVPAASPNTADRPPRPALRTQLNKTPDFGANRQRVSFRPQVDSVDSADPAEICSGDAVTSTVEPRALEIADVEVSPEASTDGESEDADSLQAVQTATQAPAAPEVDVQVSPPDAAVPPAGRQWTVHIDRSKGDPLGINLSSETLTIDNITEGGLFSSWNVANPTKAVRIGDRILDVNGKDTIEPIIKECQEFQMLLINVFSEADPATLRDTGSKPKAAAPRKASGAGEGRTRSDSAGSDRSATRKPSISGVGQKIGYKQAPGKGAPKSPSPAGSSAGGSDSGKGERSSLQRRSVEQGKQRSSLEKKSGSGSLGSQRG